MKIELLFCFGILQMTQAKYKYNTYLPGVPTKLPQVAETMRDDSLDHRLHYPANFPWTSWGGYKPLEDQTNSQDKLKIWRFGDELMIEALNKLHQVEGVRDHHINTRSFEVGYILGMIRVRYRTMLEHYREQNDRYTQRSVLYGPHLTWYWPIYMLVKYEWIHFSEVELEKLVEVLEDLAPVERVTKKFRAVDDAKRAELMAAEQQLKRRNREVYLLRRLGLPANSSTTRKRFLRRWPVADTWDLRGDQGE